MISAIRGRVFDISPGVVHLETGSGVVMQVLIPVSDYMAVKNQEEILLYTVHRVKEDQMFLYGFLTPKQKAFFEKFIAVSGVGGKTALSMISAFSPHELVDAIDSGDIRKISSVPGIGKKTAQRLILELTGKLELETEQVEETVQLREDLVSGLVNLGYPVKGVTDHVNKTMKEHPDVTSFQDLFKILLKKISKM